MRSFAYWPVLALLILIAGAFLAVTTRPPAQLRLPELAADPSRWDGKRVQVSGVVSHCDPVAKYCVDRGTYRWSFVLVNAAEDAQLQPVRIVVEARERELALRLFDGQKVMITGRYDARGCIFSHPNQLRMVAPHPSATQ